MASTLHEARLRLARFSGWRAHAETMLSIPAGVDQQAHAEQADVSLAALDEEIAKAEAELRRLEAGGRP